jgi:hypothetical protein
MQAEARVMLKGAYMAGKTRYAQASNYSSFTVFRTVTGKTLSEFAAEPNRRYNYVGNTNSDYLSCAPTKLCNGMSTTQRTGVNATGVTCNTGAYTATATGFIYRAIGNIDTDTFLDVWSIDNLNNLVNGIINPPGTITNSGNREACNDVVVQ